METTNLTKDGKEMIAVIYKEYLDRINNGISKSEAKKLGSGEELYNSLFSEWLYDDFEDTMKSLSKNNFIYTKWASNKIFRSELLDYGIIYMEGQFGNDMQKVVDFIVKIKNIVK